MSNDDEYTDLMEAEHTDVPDDMALDNIAAHLTGREWDASDIEAVAAMVRSTGRTIDSPRDPWTWRLLDGHEVDVALPANPEPGDVLLLLPGFYIMDAANEVVVGPWGSLAAITEFHADFENQVRRGHQRPDEHRVIVVMDDHTWYSTPFMIR